MNMEVIREVTVEIKEERKRNLNNMGGISHRCQWAHGMPKFTFSRSQRSKFLSHIVVEFIRKW